MTASATMRALVWTAPDAAELREEPRPVAGEGELLLRVRATGVCGSDLHGYRGHSPVRTPPLILGHEVVAADEHGALHVLNPLTGCGACRLCAEGQPNLCPRRGLLGLDRPGAFAEWVKVPAANALPLPDGMPELLGTLVEPLATPVNALGSAPLGPDSVVAVIGAGPIGLLAAFAARERGVRLVTCHDLDAARVEHARAHAGAVGTAAADVEPAIRAASGGLGADLVIDAVGVEATWRDALALVRPGGTVAEVGLAQGAGELEVGALVRNGVTVRGVYAYTPEDFRAALALLDRVRPSFDWVETAPLETGVELLARLARGEGPVKAILRP